MEPQALPRVWKFPLSTRVVLVVSFLFFSGVTIAGMYAISVDSSMEASGFLILFMGGGLVIMVWLLVMMLVTPASTLMADKEGIVPLFLPKQYQKRIRWDEIVDIMVVQQRSGRYGGKALAFYLNQERSFGPLFSGSRYGTSIMGTAGSAFSDAGAGSLYVPSLRLNEKVEIVRDTLLTIRNQQLHHA